MTDLSNRKMGFWSAFAVGVGLVVASSTLVTLGQGMGLAGGGFIFAMFAAWFLQLFSAQSFAEMTCSLPKNGTLDIFSRVAIGPFAGIMSILFGYVYMSLVTVPAELSVAGSVFNDVFIPSFSPGAFALIMLIILTITNFFGIDLFARIQMVLITIMMVFMGGLGIAGLITPSAAGDAAGTAVFNPMGMSVLGLTALAIWLYIGIEFACPLVGEVKRPEKDIPKGMVYGLIAIFIVNVLYGFASIKHVPLESLAQSTIPHVLVSKAVFGTTGKILVGVVSMCATASSVNTFLAVIPRMLYSMAENGDLPGFFTVTHPRFRTPWIGLFISFAAYALLILLGITGIEQILILILSAATAWLIAYILAHVSVIILRVKYPELKRPYKTPLYPLPQIIGIIGMIYAIWAVSDDYLTRMEIYKYTAVAFVICAAYAVLWIKFKSKKKLFTPVSLEEEMGPEFMATAFEK